MDPLWLIGIVVVIAFIFDFINGFHDAANSIATIVSTGVLKPFHAVLWAAFFNFIAFLFFELHVANTFSMGLISPASLNTYVIFSALTSAILFNLFTWLVGLPSSSSHALIGGLVGAAIAHQGWHSLIIGGLSKTFIAMLISPLLGILFSFVLLFILNRCFAQHQKNLIWDKALQLISSALLSLGHGANDAQKTMGIIAAVLFSAHLLGPNFYVPWWVIISCNIVMGLGTLAGGHRIIHTLGTKITPLVPRSGAAAQTASAMILFSATSLGIPVSTTHIVTGSIVGVGLAKGRTNWSILHRIVWAWLLTLPCTALIAAGIQSLHLF